MHLITYVSTAHTLFDQAALEALLNKSRTNNLKFGITGMLLYKGGNFIQVIEGPEQHVLQLYSNIKADPSHNTVTTVLDEPVPERLFPDWTMGFSNLGTDPLLPGFTNFLQNYETIQEFFKSPSDAKRLLSLFGKSMR